MVRLRNQILLASLLVLAMFVGGGALLLHELSHWQLATTQVSLAHERGVLDGQFQTAVTRATAETSNYVLLREQRYRIEAAEALERAQQAIHEIRKNEDADRALPIIGNQWHSSILPVPPKPPPSGILARQERLLDQVVIAVADAERAALTATSNSLILERLYTHEAFADQLWRDAAAVHDVSQEESEITVDQHRRLIFLLIFSSLGAVAFAVLLLLAFIGRHIVRPLGVLAEGAGKVASGNLDTRLVVNYRNEIGQLQQRFNDMIVHLGEQRAEIERLVDSRTQARDAAETASRAKSEFLAKMSHEIRTPMHGISLTLDLLNSSVRDAEQRELTELARDSARQLTALIDDTLDFTRIEAGHMRLDLAVFDVRELIAGIDKLDGQRAKQKSLQWEFMIDDAVPTRVWGDALRLNQILHNLLDNAIRFTAKGRVSLRVAVADSEKPQPSGAVKAPGAKAPVRIRFSVSDTGIGVPPELLEGIFEPFRQADDTTTKRFGGSGLGLAIVSQLAELMGGEITVDSTPKVGSCFSFTAWFRPDARKAVRESASEAPSKPLPGGKSILLAEDNAGNRMVIERLLRRAGLDVTTAENGREAIKAASRQHFDLILMDCFMPEVDGFQAARGIRTLDGPRGQVPIIALTAFALDEGVLHSRESGMNGFLSKPYTEEQLFELLHHWLGDDAMPPTDKEQAVQGESRSTPH